MPRGTRRDDEAGLALPEMVMAQLLSPDSARAARGHGRDQPSGPRSSSAPGSAGAPPSCAHSASTCLDYDTHTGDDGKRRASPVLVHDMPKVSKAGCRLPVHEREADIIRAQQQRVRASFPDTPIDRLVLFPRPLKNPEGTKPIGTAHLQRAMRAWVEPPCLASTAPSATRRRARSPSPESGSSPTPSGTASPSATPTRARRWTP